MDEVMIANRSRTGEPTATAKRTLFDVVQELTRHGYVPSPLPLDGSKGILFRHQTAPDLLLREDGTVDIPLNQRPKVEAPVAPARQTGPHRIKWRRGLLFLALLALTTFLSSAILIAILNG